MRRLSLLLFLLAIPLQAQQLGSISFPNSGSEAAQKPFLRGVAALHSFWYEEAADAFREAESIDPTFALAYWGEAMTYNHPIWMEVDLPAAKKVLDKLATIPTKTPREAGYVDAIRALYGAGEKHDRDVAYEHAMEQLALANPNDVEAQTFHALSILGLRAADEPDARKQIRAAAILEPLYAANPVHPGVLHYLIHAYDDPLHAPLGLRAAQSYAKVAPAAFHALHMPSHIFLQLGMWRETIASNEQSYAVSKEWTARKNLPRTKRDLHSLQWLQYAYLQENRFADAKKLLAEIAPADGEDVRERTTRSTMLARYAIETSDWSVLPSTLAAPAAADAPHAGCGTPKRYGGDSSPLAFAFGLAAISRGDESSVKIALDQLAALRAAKKDEVAARTIDVMTKELQASLAASKGEVKRSLELASEAVALEERLGSPSGPPDTIKPALELYGELLLKTGDTKLAAEQFQRSLARTPNRRLSMAGAEKAGTINHAITMAVAGAP
jgi:tetratricopeptide (TPR) repeat protein